MAAPADYPSHLKLVSVKLPILLRPLLGSQCFLSFLPLASARLSAEPALTPHVPRDSTSYEAALLLQELEERELCHGGPSRALGGCWAEWL